MTDGPEVRPADLEQEIFCLMRRVRRTNRVRNWAAGVIIGLSVPCWIAVIAASYKIDYQLKHNHTMGKDFGVFDNAGIAAAVTAYKAANYQKPVPDKNEIRYTATQLFSTGFEATLSFVVRDGKMLIYDEKTTKIAADSAPPATKTANAKAAKASKTVSATPAAPTGTAVDAAQAAKASAGTTLTDKQAGT